MLEVVVLIDTVVLSHQAARLFSLLLQSCSPDGRGSDRFQPAPVPVDRHVRAFGLLCRAFRVDY
jgi:hypothetical protein